MHSDSFGVIFYASIVFFAIQSTNFVRGNGITGDEEDTCSDKNDCFRQDLKIWLQTISNKKHDLDCKIDSGPKSAGQQPLYALANCNDDGATWKYKYSGAKGKKRIPHGKGKMSFTKLSTPPHGYDFGMKSGHCLIISDDIASLEGNFDQGVLKGSADIAYHDEKTAKVFIDENGAIYGPIRKYEVEIDKETNRKLSEKRFYSIGFYDGGKLMDRMEWFSKENGVKILTSISDGQTLALAKGNNGSEIIFMGNYDVKDDMMTKAREVKIIELKMKNCLMVPEVVAFGPEFDFDLEVQSVTQATVAKLVRFFEFITDNKKGITSKFSAIEEALSKNAVKFFDIKKVGKKFHEVETLNGPAKIAAETTKMKEDSALPNGHTTVRFLSGFKRKELGSFMKNTGDDDEEGESPSQTSNGVDYQDFLEEFIPYENLPYKPSNAESVIKSISGKFVNGFVSGLVTITYLDGSRIEALAKDNVFHGLVRHFDPPLLKGKRKRYVRRADDNAIVASMGMTKDDPISEVNFVGSYKNGQLDGPGWKFNVGGTYHFGKFKGSGSFTTDQGAYVNQDLETAYFGRFVDGRMMAAQSTKVINHSVENGVPVLEFSEPEGKVFRAVIVGDDIVDPLVTDVTEDNWVYVAKSPLGPDFGEGLFAKKDIPLNTVVAYFGGKYTTFEEWNKTKEIDPNYWQKHEAGGVVYLPEEYGKDITKYKATLGHKINHSFNNWNCMFHSLDHPRFGTIPAARTTANVAKNEELLCLYEFQYDEGAPWYQELWRREIDNDFIFGPFGHRGSKKSEGEEMVPQLANGTLYKKFYKHAVEVLNLSPLT